MNAKEFVDVVRKASEEKTKSYDTTAVVKRVEGDTLWVHIAGGADETPVRRTVDAKAGDTVQIRVANGDAWAQGNGTAPPTDDTAANAAQDTADGAERMARTAAAAADKAVAAADAAEAEAGRAKAAADTAQETAESVHDIAVQASEDAAAASTAAATADSKATAAGTAAAAAQTSADNAATAAATADSKATAASAAATRAETKADTASAAASRAESSASAAESAAASAQTSADGALVGLSTVQDVVGVLNWITAHGTMISQSGKTFDENKVYFIQDPNGDYIVGGVRYSLVAEPKAEDINSYYVLSVDESVQNYVATHIVVDSEGLWLIPENNATPATSSKKILIAVGGSGHTYETAGTYIIGKVNNVDKVLAKFISTGATVGQIDGAHSEIDGDGQRFYMSDGTTQLANIGYGRGASESGTNTAPYYSFGYRVPNSGIGNFSMAEGNAITASGYASHAEGLRTTASGRYSHAEGSDTTAGGEYSHAEGSGTYAGDLYSHAEGSNTTASGVNSHAQNKGTIAAKDNQTVIGKYNVEDTETTTSKQKAFIIGNGTTNTARSNAFDVDWEGNTEAAGDIADGSGNVLADKADSSSLATVATTGSYDDLLNLPALATVATTGSYDDLSNKPTIPTVNNATLTIQKNGTNVQTFSANAASNKTANITVPTKTSDLTNDSGFITQDSNGDVSVTRNISAGGKATFGAINGDSLFDYSTVSMTSSSISANASGEVTSSASTKTNYYPIAITNVNISTGQASLRRFYFSTQQSGKAVVKIGLQNDGTSAKTISVSADILWVKIAV